MNRKYVNMLKCMIFSLKHLAMKKNEEFFKINMKNLSKSMSCGQFLVIEFKKRNWQPWFEKDFSQGIF
ncbi:MAG: hypothetical protein CMB97_01600 [Flavobacteriaceae bacterium]|nr:hypothetical protein [Flavobacteriaceae bacterium]